MTDDAREFIWPGSGGARARAALMRIADALDAPMTLNVEARSVIAAVIRRWANPAITGSEIERGLVEVAEYLMREWEHRA